MLLKTNHKFIFQSILCFCFMFLLQACGGGDTPFTQSSTTPPGTTPSGASQTPRPLSAIEGGCNIGFRNVELQMLAKLTAGSARADETTRAEGLLSSNPSTVQSPIPINFNFNGSSWVVLMSSQNFPTINLTLGGFPVQVRMQSGSVARGTYNSETGQVTINNIRFSVSSSLGQFNPSFSLLTTESGTQMGAYGSLPYEGSRLSASTRALRLVAGGQIPAAAISVIPELDNAALVVSLSGDLQTMPTPETCRGSGALNGITIEEVIRPNPAVDSMGGPLPPSTRALTENINFGNVYIPEMENTTHRILENVPLNDFRFVKQKVIRIRNLEGAQRINTTLVSSNGFEITPSGSVSLEGGQSQDFTIRFGAFNPVVYTSSTPAVTEDRTLALNFGRTTITLRGKAKRANPELKILNADGSELAPGAIDLGNVRVDAIPDPIRTSEYTLSCLPGGRSINASLSQILKIKNYGTRPLRVKVNPAVDDLRQVADAACSRRTSEEFLRTTPSAMPGSSCVGASLDECQITGDSQVNFTLSYLPMNASSVVNADTAKLIFSQVNDPTVDPMHLPVLSLQAKVTPFVEPVLSLRQGAGADVRNPINNGDTLRISTASLDASDFTSDLALVNPLGTTGMNIRSMLLTSHSTDASFEIIGAPTLVRASDTAAFQIKVTKTNPANRGSFKATLTITYREEGNPVDQSVNFIIQALFAVRPVVGRVEIRMERNVTVAPGVAALAEGRSFIISDDTGLAGNNEAHAAGNIPVIIDEPNSFGISRARILLPPHFGPDDDDLLHNLQYTDDATREKLVRMVSQTYTDMPAGMTWSNLMINCEKNPGVSPLLITSYRAGDCGYWYYFIGSREDFPGYYDQQTGELTLPVDIKILAPYHGRNNPLGSAGMVMDTRINYLHNPLILTTRLINRRAFNSYLSPTQPLYFAPSGGNISLELEPEPISRFLDSAGQSRYRRSCPSDWDPATARVQSAMGWEDPFACYVSSSAPYYYKGYPVTPVEGENRHVVILDVVFRMSSNPGDGIPRSMQNSMFYAAFRGSVFVCQDGGMTNVNCSGSSLTQAWE